MQRVLVVTDDVSLASVLAELGVDVIPDGVSDDLNGSLAAAWKQMQEGNQRFVDDDGFERGGFGHLRLVPKLRTVCNSVSVTV